MPNLTSRQTLLALALIAAVLSASGFILEYGFHVIPCKMCWWQRYAHYAILAISLLGLSMPRQSHLAFGSVILASVGGLTIAVWQFCAQHGWLPFPASCGADTTQTFAAASNLLESLNKTKIIPCDQETFTLLGLSLAGWNIPAMLLTNFLALRAFTRR